MSELNAATFDFRLPDVGEGLDEAEIIHWKVVVGQEITVNQVVVEIETAKALVELPSPYAGTVVELLVQEGQTVSVGTAIIRIQLNEPAPSDGQSGEIKPERTDMLVGSGPKNDEDRSRRRTPRNYGGGSPNVVAASIPVKESIAPILITDSNANSRESRVPIKGVRRVMAEAMVTSAFTAPHVTEFVTVDVSASMTLLEQLRMQPEFAGIRLSPLTLLARGMCIAARSTPEINSFWDGQAQEIVTKQYVNLGIATATERGLLVPNIKDADQLGLKELAQAIAEIVDTARVGRMKPAQMVGGTMSITNIGVFGIESGTPILPPGESAIVCLGAVVDRPWVVEGAIVVRAVTTLALSFDHRLVDGAQGSKFLSDIAAMLHDPAPLIESI